jgi:YVTN family beta-propeller protein
MRRGLACWALGAAIAGALVGLAAAAPREIGRPTQERPHAVPGGFDLPSGWRITPAAPAVAKTGDWVVKLTTAPDGRAVIALNAGFLPHGLTVIDPVTRKAVQHIRLRSAWLGMSWAPDGKTLYVSGGNANGDGAKPEKPPIYAFAYHDGRLSEDPVARFDETAPLSQVWWSGVARDPTGPRLYAANRGVAAEPTAVTVFDLDGKIRGRIPVEISPYELVLSPDARRLFVSNWSSGSVSVIDTREDRVISTIRVGANPNDMALAPDGRLFVACSNDNTVYVIDTRRLAVVERLSTTLTALAPEGSTPDALAIDPVRRLLFVANADNNDIAVISIKNPSHSEVLGFVPVGWYPSALTIAEHGQALYIGAAKGEASYPDLRGPQNPTVKNWDGDESIKTLQVGAVERLPLAGLLGKLPAWTRQAMANSPYRDALLQHARASAAPSVIPSEVGAGSPIQHVIYIIKENRTYDQVFGDLPHANGDPKLTLFGADVTPNHHALAQQFVTLDNFYCDGEVSVDGHSWSNAAYATDFNEKWWPPTYGGWSGSQPAPAYIPASGHLWDLARRKGLTYRTYGEYTVRPSRGGPMQAVAGIDALWGHVAPDYGGDGLRDTDNVAAFLKEFDGFEANFDSPDPEKRLPNYIVMSMPEDHTRGARPGAFTPIAMVASNDYALGQLVDRVSHSKYWPTTAIFVLEDDAQDGPDHVDARRTVALLISPYVKRGTVDSTFYTTSSFIRSIELLLGLPPMSQFDAAATPLYASMGATADLTPYSVIGPKVALNAKNTVAAWGAEESAKMDFSDNDRAPMRLLNEVIWKSVKGADSPMPAPVHRFRALLDGGAPPR